MVADANRVDFFLLRSNVGGRAWYRRLSGMRFAMRLRHILVAVQQAQTVSVLWDPSPRVVT